MSLWASAASGAKQEITPGAADPLDPKVAAAFLTTPEGLLSLFQTLHFAYKTYII